LSFIKRDAPLKIRQQLHRSKFLVSLPEERNALLALSLVQMLCESINVGMPEFFAWFKVWGAIQNGNHFVWQFVAWVFAAHADLGFCRDRTNQNANPNAKAITSQQIGLNTVASISPATTALSPVAWPVPIDIGPRIMPIRTPRKR
jgi:hypothetical protein